MKRKLIVFVPSLAGGGAERVASTLLPYLTGHFDLTLALIENRISYRIPEGVRVAIFSDRLQSPAAHILRIGPHLGRLIQLVRKSGVPVVLSFMEQANILNILASKVTGHKAVISQHIPPRLQHSREKGRLGIFILQAARRLYPRADMVITVSEGIRRSLLEDFRLHPKLVMTIPNPIDCRTISDQAAIRPSIALPNGYILHVGRIKLRHKAQEVLLEAFASSAGLGERLHLVFIGDGPDRSFLEERVRALGIGDKVLFLGWQSNVPAYMSRARIFVLCSRYEGWPMALLEAMACGCPAISTDCPTGPREILADGRYGLLVPLNDPAVLAGAIEKLDNDEVLRQDLGHRAILRAREFDIMAIGPKYASLLNEI